MPDMALAVLVKRVMALLPETFELSARRMSVPGLISTPPPEKRVAALAAETEPWLTTRAAMETPSLRAVGSAGRLLPKVLALAKRRTPAPLLPLPLPALL